jgi:hypothetical protein
MTQGPDVGGERRHLILRELSAAHGWHGGAVLFRLCHTGGNRFRNRRIATVAPQPV